MRGITTSGKRWALILGLLIAFALPRHVPCGYPGAVNCQRPGRFPGDRCTPYELEPFGFYLLELWLDRDIGFAYTTGEDCR